MQRNFNGETEQLHIVGQNSRKQCAMQTLMLKPKTLRLIEDQGGMVFR